MSLPNLSDLLYDWRERRWKPVSIVGLIGGLLLFLILGFPTGKTVLGRFNVMHTIATIPHEGGHMIVGGLAGVVSSITGRPIESDPLATRGFDAFARFLVIAAGTGGQLLVLLIPAGIYFWRKSSTPLLVCTFAIFASLPGIGIYMMDCRVLTLDYISPGGADYEGIQQFGQDWTFIFRYLGIPMGAGESLGKLTYNLGWLGMLATAAVLAWLYYRASSTGSAFRAGA